MRWCDFRYGSACRLPVLLDPSHGVPHWERHIRREALSKAEAQRVQGIDATNLKGTRVFPQKKHGTLLGDPWVLANG